LPCGLIKEFHDGRTWIGVHLANTLLAVTYQPVKGMSMSSSKIVTAWRVIPILACVMYLIVGPAAMVVNNDIMNSLHFPYPLTISALGVGSSALVARIAALLGLAQIRDHTAKFLCSSQWCRCILPLGASYAVTLATGNAVYLVLGIIHPDAQGSCSDLCPARYCAARSGGAKHGDNFLCLPYFVGNYHYYCHSARVEPSRTVSHVCCMCCRSSAISTDTVPAHILQDECFRRTAYRCACGGLFPVCNSCSSGVSSDFF